MSSVTRRLRLLAALALPLFVCLLANLWAGARPDAPPIASAALSGVRVTFLYHTDSAAATSFQTFLQGNGYVVTLVQIAGDGSATVSPSTTDLFMLGADTANGANWFGNSALSNAIQNSLKPVVGLGEGGRTYFAHAGLTIGTAPHTQWSTRDVVATDLLLTHVFYQSPNAISLPPDQHLALYNSNVSASGVQLPDLLPDGSRIGALPVQQIFLPLIKNSSGAQSSAQPVPAAAAPVFNYFSILQEGGKFALWGYAGAPSAMTASGQQLFLNLLTSEISPLVVPLRSRSFVPPPGIDPAFVTALGATALPNLHAYVQLDHPSDAADVATLQAKSVRLVDYVHGLTYIGAVSKTLNANDPVLLALVRWLSGIPAADKVDPKVLAGQFDSWADNGDGTVNLLVTVFNDVNSAEGTAAISAHTGVLTPTGSTTWQVRIAKSQIVPLAGEDRVQWIEEEVPSFEVNDQARADLDVNSVQDLDTSSGFYRGLDGTGIRIMIVDTGINSTTVAVRHPDLPASKFVREARDGNSHGTHVGGIAAGTGQNSVAACPYGGGCTPFLMRGMAPGARIATYYNNAAGQDAAAFDESINTLKIEVSSHSYIMGCGDYNARARDLDRQIRGDASNGSTPIPARTEDWAAANQGGTGAQYCTTATLPMTTVADPTSGPRGFFSVLSPMKNAIIVGAVQRGAPQNVYIFSSRGPTWDGRIKPDVSAVGCENSTSLFSSGYIWKCGTSMATPATSGIVALMLEQFHRTFGAVFNPYPSTVKSVLIDTATDAVHTPADPAIGPDPDTGGNVVYYQGPDWSTGYGIVDARRATGLVASKGFVENNVSPGTPTRSYTFTVSDGRRNAKVTLAWDDEPGNPALAFTAAQLVNDLDLTLRDPNGVTYYPYVLPPLTPSAVLTSGTPDPITTAQLTVPVKIADHLNNVEQVEISATTQLVTGVWTIRVNAFALPNGNPQKFSVAADLRRPELINPVQGAAANAGDPAAPDKIIVQLSARTDLAAGRVSMQDAQQGDFAVSIDGLPASVVSGYAVGDQFWLVVQPAPVSGPGYKNLAVTWNGYGTAKAKNAVLFLEHIPVDRILVIDKSGSMGDSGKMGAAQNAARLYVDQTNISDTIGVVAFESTASVPYSLTLVLTGSTTLNDAKTAINGLTPGGATAMGQGIDKGEDELERVNRADPDWVMTLLTDGYENVAPLWASAAVRDRLLAAKTIINTVAVGPPSEVDQALLATIAAQKSGRAYAVNTTGGFLATASAPFSVGDFATTLDNKLADVYKSISEDAGRQQRLWEVHAFDSALRCQEPAPYLVNMESNLPQAIFADNWTTGGEPQLMQIFDPRGNLLVVGPDVQHRTDVTHDTWLVARPLPGTWKVFINSLKCGSGTEYIAFMSAHSPLTLQGFFGGDPNDRCVGRPVQVLALLADSAPIPAPEGFVSVTVLGPTLEQSVNSLVLFDDGLHGDGKAHDGLYGNLFTKATAPGSYGVKFYAQGTSHKGEPFLRRRLESFFVRPCVAYIYEHDTASADSYQSLLEANGFAVNLIATADVTPTDWSKYNLVVVGHDTGNLDHWDGGTFGPAMMAQFGVPVIGNGEGGYAFFGLPHLDIGYPNGAHSGGTNVIPLNPGDPAWNMPYSVTITAREVQLYERASRLVEIFDDKALPLVHIGRDPLDSNYLPLVQQGTIGAGPRPYLLWGWDDPPSAMTTSGQWVYVNLAWYMRR